MDVELSHRDRATLRAVMERFRDFEQVGRTPEPNVDLTYAFFDTEIRHSEGWSAFLAKLEGYGWLELGVDDRRRIAGALAMLAQAPNATAEFDIDDLAVKVGLNPTSFNLIEDDPL